MPVSFNKFRFKNLEEILKVVEKALSTYGIDFYLIGALARDIQLTGRYNIKAQRATQDIDYAIMIHDYDIYNQLSCDLVTLYGFEDTSLPYRFKYKDNTLIDLLPFGDIETDERSVTLKGRKIEELTVIGLEENFKHTEEIEFDDGFRIHVSSLGGICLLKFFSWYHKPYDRERDINDINFILSKYTEIFSDDIFEQHDDLLELDWDRGLAPRLLGRHMGNILNENTESRIRLITLLEEQLNEDSMLPVLFTRFNRKPVEENISAIRENITGIKGLKGTIKIHHIQIVPQKPGKIIVVRWNW